MRVLVCGGRNFADRALLNKVLDEAHMAGPITTLIHGVAKGADTLAAEWADLRHVPVEGHRADWKRYGKDAGPIRNARMLEQGKPRMVIAFPGGNGTADMVRQARKAGVPVMMVEKLVR